MNRIISNDPEYSNILESCRLRDFDWLEIGCIYEIRHGINQGKYKYIGIEEYLPFDGAKRFDYCLYFEGVDSTTNIFVWHGSDPWRFEHYTCNKI